MSREYTYFIGKITNRNDLEIQIRNLVDEANNKKRDIISFKVKDVIGGTFIFGLLKKRKKEIADS